MYSSLNILNITLMAVLLAVGVYVSTQDDVTASAIWTEETVIQ